MIRIGNFPDTVNEYAARTVAGLVVILSLAAIITQSLWLVGALFYGFSARVLYGPKYSPFAKLAIHGIVPLFGLGSKVVAGPPKRFAQFVGVIFSGTAFLLLSLGQSLAFQFVLGVLVIFASLESILGFCAGCFVFGFLIKWGWIPEEVCEKCNNLQFVIKE
ncbi:DUF4395 domain-containing protein [Leptospira licerasiae]|uniref:PF14340 domain protein n=1 Tax=Leptospira licerasiae str. MMD4847 TaxID=1049971 RepID=A0ABP2RJF2_9LEPT|nr:DUF4395 domain-containing protein [Leptospira licerasiae]EIE01309.1 hypothetical protein LEP1GSC185_3500 [Leptospira licerasiae serovar Varillal str. VAR 010]EJZ43421.1 PF14340 domain protein [Leptospira licerasiae str. MMD4847]